MSKYNEGEIYLINEIDYPSRLRTNFYKIGLVHYSDDRNSETRLLEHQTGNPRRLVIAPAGVLQTQAVDLVEAQLHKFFATKRIFGEWFEFLNEEELAGVMKQARIYSEEVNRRLTLFKEANAFRIKDSNGDKIPATPEVLEKAERCAQYKAQVSKCVELLDRIEVILTIKHEAGADVDKVARASVRKYAPRLNEKLLKEEQFEIWQKYLKDSVKRNHTFRPTLGAASVSELDPEFQAKLNELNSIVDEVESGDELYKLVDANLELTHLKAVAQWEADVITAELQIATGLNDGITGVSSWVRADVPERIFDEEWFASENPELAHEYAKPERVTSKLKVNKTKS